MKMKTFCIKRNINYQEVMANGNLFEKFYEIDNPCNDKLITIPDGSIDIQCLWRNNKLKVLIVGSFREGGASLLTEYDKCFGGRLIRGVVPSCFKGFMEDIISNRIPIESFLRIPEMEDLISFDLPLEQKADCMLSLLENAMITDENIITKHIINTIEKEHGNVIIGDMVETLGYSHRYTNRVFKSNVGLSIKNYANIVRLQESLRYIRLQRDDDIYSKLGYYDQAHFIHDFKKFSSFTPNAMKKIQDINFV